MVDERPVAMRLLYDWGAWCYLVYSVESLDGEADGSSALRDGSARGGCDAREAAAGDDGSASWPDPDGESGRKRGRGGSL